MPGGMIGALLMVQGMPFRPDRHQSDREKKKEGKAEGRLFEFPSSHRDYPLSHPGGAPALRASSGRTFIQHPLPSRTCPL